jgi:hypothetical protein
MRGCLAEGYPFVLGFTVYESFESDTVAQTGIVPMPRSGEQVLGGHCVVALVEKRGAKNELKPANLKQVAPDVTRAAVLRDAAVYINSTIGNCRFRAYNRLGALSDIATKGSQEPAQQNQRKRTAKPRRIKA